MGLESLLTGLEQQPEIAVTPVTAVTLPKATDKPLIIKDVTPVPPVTPVFAQVKTVVLPMSQKTPPALPPGYPPVGTSPKDWTPEQREVVRRCFHGPTGIHLLSRSKAGRQS